MVTVFAASSKLASTTASLGSATSAGTSADTCIGSMCMPAGVSTSKASEVNVLTGSSNGLSSCAADIGSTSPVSSSTRACSSNERAASANGGCVRSNCDSSSNGEDAIGSAAGSIVGM